MTNFTNDGSNCRKPLISAIIPVICKVCQAGKRFSAVTPVICRVCQANTVLKTLPMTGLTAEHCLPA
jgi:hypothetical protein